MPLTARFQRARTTPGAVRFDAISAVDEGVARCLYISKWAAEDLGEPEQIDVVIGFAGEFDDPEA